MQRLLKKGICALLSFALLAVFPAVSASAAKAYTDPDYTRHWKVPVGARLCFQTPPLKKSEKLCYTAGNGEILQTFIAGDSTENSDGTVSYSLGAVCVKAGESGLYIIRNGKLFPAACVQVVNDRSKDGFPLSTSFNRIFANWRIEKITVRDENTGKLRQTKNLVKIRNFMEKLSPERVYRNCGAVPRDGGFFTVEFYLKGQNGAYAYSPGFGFGKTDDFSAPLPTGDCVEENLDKVCSVISDFYKGLS